MKGRLPQQRGGERRGAVGSGAHWSRECWEEMAESAAVGRVEEHPPCCGKHRGGPACGVMSQINRY